jgi:transposase
MNPKESYQISDELWAKIQPLLPQHVNTHRFGGGRPRADDRKCMNAIWFVLRTGCQWDALDATGICPSSTAHDRFQEWVKAGVFYQLWKAGLLEYDQHKGLDWAWQSMDGAMTKAPLGGEKMRTEPHGSGEKRRQTQPADGGQRRAGRLGGGRRQSQ